MSLAVKKVELKSRPDLDIYVRSFSAFEAFEQEEQFKDVPDEGPGTVAAMLSVYICNEKGERTYPTLEAATEFMRTVKNGVVKKIIDEGRKFNRITDETIEEERKN